MNRRRCHDVGREGGADVGGRSTGDAEERGRMGRKRIPKDPRGSIRRVGSRVAKRKCEETHRSGALATTRVTAPSIKRRRNRCGRACKMCHTGATRRRRSRSGEWGAIPHGSNIGRFARRVGELRSGASFSSLEAGAKRVMINVGDYVGTVKAQGSENR